MIDQAAGHDGPVYGVEFKNQLRYIDRTEIELNLRMCASLGFRAMFGTRMVPAKPRQRCD